MTDYYRTGAGAHRHADWYCANARRSVMTGDPIKLGAEDAVNWAPCEHCTSPAEIARETAPKVEKPAKCTGQNVVPDNPLKLYRRCADCGYEGRIMPSGNLRAHKPAK